MNEDPKWDVLELCEVESDYLSNILFRVFDLEIFADYVKSSLVCVPVIVFLFSKIF
ncbi:MAG: hypothetical protein ACJAQ2_002190 [Vicingaceae bacterium]|jgi:hypothetical protein